MAPSRLPAWRSSSRDKSRCLRFGVLLMVGLAYPALGRSTPRCTTCTGPKVSWDTLPVAFHSAETRTGELGTFSEAELATIAKFPIATIEKWQGSDAVGADGSTPVFLWEEEAMINSAKAIKARSPSTSVVVWLDSMRIYTGWYWPASGHSGVNHTLNPDAKPACATGHFQPAGFLETHPDGYIAHNASNLPALEPWSGCHMYDFTQDVSREFWLEMCLNLTASGVIDGCGADASWQLACILNDPTDPSSGCKSAGFGMNATFANSWDRGRHSALRATTAALGDGVLLGKTPEELWDPSLYGEKTRYVNGALHEGCEASNTTINSLLNVTAAAKASGERLIYECHADCYNGAKPSAAKCVDSVAAFLIGAGDDHYFATGGWTSSAADNGTFATHWVPGLFDQPLGVPLGDAVYDASTGSWARSFAHGTHVQFNTTNNRGAISWGSKP